MTETKSPESHLDSAPQEGSSMGEKPPQQGVLEPKPIPTVNLHSSQSIANQNGRRIEGLTRRVEMLTFEGWNQEGWIFRVERFFTTHRITKEEKMTAATISFDGEALAWF